MEQQPKKKKVCNHEGGITLYRSSIDHHWFFHCHRCRTVISKDFSTKLKAENWATKQKLPEYMIETRTKT